MNARIIAGRDFTADDACRRPPVAIVDESSRRPGVAGAETPWASDSRCNRPAARTCTSRWSASWRTSGPRPDPRGPAPALSPHRPADLVQADVVVEAAGNPAVAGAGGDPGGARDGQDHRPPANDPARQLRRRRDGPEPLQPAADGGPRRHRPGAGRGGDLRRDRLLGEPAHPRIRHPAGAGRGAGAYSAERGVRRHAAGRGEHGARGSPRRSRSPGCSAASSIRWLRAIRSLSPGSRRCWRWWRSWPATSPRGGRPGWTRRSRSAANDHYSE